MDNPKETYLGDGLYASFNGWHFILRAPRIDGDHFAYIDPFVLEAFDAFVKATYKKIETETKESSGG